jgi:hypothetical protein
MSLLKRVTVLVVASAVAVGSVSAQVTVGTPGAGQPNNFPFGKSAGYTKFQEFLNASYFTAPLNINAVTFYRTANTTGTFQQGTFSLFLNSTTTTLNNYNFSNPSANEVAANRKLIGTFVVADAATTAATIKFTGAGTFNYNPAMGNLLIDVDFTPVGGFFGGGSATFDSFSDQVNFNQSNLVATSSDPNVPFGYNASARGSGLVATFGVASTVVPEPSSVFLMSAGLAGLLFAARRKKAV